MVNEAKNIGDEDRAGKTEQGQQARDVVKEARALYSQALKEKSMFVRVPRRVLSALCDEVERLRKVVDTPPNARAVCDCHTWPTVSKLHDYVVDLERRIRPEHKCERIATGVMDEGRDWWIGKLLEPIPEWPKETHCLHMKTPIKTVSFLCNSGDFEQLMVLSNVVTGLQNLEWLESMTDGAKRRRG